jgi:hypothetical protein
MRLQRDWERDVLEIQVQRSLHKWSRLPDK